MFLNKEKRQAKEKINIQINDLKMYLENNYKDLAIQAHKDAITLVEECYEKGQIRNTSYVKYKKVLGEYTQKMKDYNHQQFYKS